VQVNGKLRAKIVVPAGADAATLESAARSDERVQTALDDREVRRVVTVPGRLINFVV
jgi:leucyl-tRNA synthetase